MLIPGTLKWNKLSIDTQNLMLNYYCNIKTGISVVLLIYIIYQLHVLISLYKNKDNSN